MQVNTIVWFVNNSFAVTDILTNTLINYIFFLGTCFLIFKTPANELLYSGIT
jgi:hypothetical protein